METTAPRLLIADDDRDFRESLAEVFARRGFNTHLAADGCEAVEFVRTSSDLHIVLLDIHMPRLTGLEALEQIREVSTDGLPCVLMSAKLDDSIVRRAAQLDTASLLSKPFTLRDVTHTIDGVLRQAYGPEFGSQRGLN